MEDKNIRKYAQLMHELDLSALELSENGSTLRLERNSAPAPSLVSAATASAPAPLAAPIEDANLVSVTCPMVGVFYASAAENQASFVSLGSRVRRGDVLCIIESMKLMNEIVSEYDGVITELCVGNQQVVDYGHVLFRIRKETV